MTADRDFVGYLLELLAPFDDITAKRMFSGYGLFRDGLMFALVVDATLYLKTDQQSQPYFDERELEPFTYLRANKPIRMAYHRAPEEVLDSSESMCEWAALAYQTALRAQQSTKSKVTNSKKARSAPQ